MIIRFHKITYSYLYTINTKSEIFDQRTTLSVQLAIKNHRMDTNLHAHIYNAEIYNH